ncbi:hypothetical protein KFE25_003664 [Diacronema lutheri]|uniref:Origin recognition complex subunit 2 RecA-like domain-containing protein n=1 Tax=Diacronema lutheri TaxID=2081491 RepID=A0A8J5XLH1_DIALT|nr:hypothetical protein KFE25_003664 [Diacronema lutheri]
MTPTRGARRRGGASGARGGEAATRTRGLTTAEPSTAAHATHALRTPPSAVARGAAGARGGDGRESEGSLSDGSSSDAADEDDQEGDADAVAAADGSAQYRALLARAARAAARADGDAGADEAERGDERADAYFSAQRRHSGVDLGRLISALPGAGDPEQLRASTRALGTSERARLSAAQQRAFCGRHARWLSLLRSGVHVLLHGAGSKRPVLDHFVAHTLARTGAPVVVLRGYCARARMRDLFALILARLGGGGGLGAQPLVAAASARDACAAIEAALARGRLAADAAAAQRDDDDEGDADGDGDGFDGDGDGAGAKRGGSGAHTSGAGAGSGSPASCSAAQRRNGFLPAFRALLPRPPAGADARALGALGAARTLAHEEEEEEERAEGERDGRGGGAGDGVVASPAAAVLRRRLGGARGVNADALVVESVRGAARALGLAPAPLASTAAAAAACASARAQQRCSAGAHIPSELFVVAHSIDASALRGERSQDALAALAACAGVRLIASVDHVNAAILWDSARSASFGWAWEAAHTALPHLQEMTDGDALAQLLGGAAGGRGGALALAHAASARAVLAALNSTGKKIFRELAQRALHAAEPTCGGGDDGGSGCADSEGEEEGGVCDDGAWGARGHAPARSAGAKRKRGRAKRAPAPAVSAAAARAAAAAARGLTLPELMERCRRGLIATAHAGVCRHLGELIDHKLVALERSSGCERYACVLPAPIIRELLSGALAQL